MTSSIHLEPSPRFSLSHPQSFVTKLRLGILAGVTVTWIFYPTTQRLLKSTSYLVAEKSPLPIIFTGILGVALIESIGLAYEIAKRILGNRSLFENLASDEVDLLTHINKYRYRAWKVIFWLEQRLTVVDVIYSRIFRIRTEKELQEDAIPETELKLMEIVRKAFKAQVEETVNEEYPESGYSVLLFNFVLGVSDKVNQISQAIQTKKIEEKRQSEETKAWCTILDAFASQYEGTGSFDCSLPPPLYETKYEATDQDASSLSSSDS